MALTVAQVFKILAVVAVIGGVLVTREVATETLDGEGDVTQVAALGTAATVVSAAVLAFFG